MIGYVIGLLLGVVVLVLQYLKPSSLGFRLMALILSVVFMWSIYYAHLNYWNIAIIPLGVLVVCFISAFCFPYMDVSAKTEYMAVNGHNYYEELKDDDIIGEVDCPGFKQTYDRIMSGVLSKVVTSQDEFQQLWKFLYSNTFYPISKHSKKEIKLHITSAVEKVSIESKHGNEIRRNAKNNIELIFNTFVCVMSIHEETTRNMEQL